MLREPEKRGLSSVIQHFYIDCFTETESSFVSPCRYALVQSGMLFLEGLLESAIADLDAVKSEGYIAKHHYEFVSFMVKSFNVYSDRHCQHSHGIANVPPHFSQTTT